MQVAPLYCHQWFGSCCICFLPSQGLLPQLFVVVDWKTLVAAAVKKKVGRLFNGKTNAAHCKLETGGLVECGTWTQREVFPLCLAYCWNISLLLVCCGAFFFFFQQMLQHSVCWIFFFTLSKWLSLWFWLLTCQHSNHTIDSHHREMLKGHGVETTTQLDSLKLHLKQSQAKSA